VAGGGELVNDYPSLDATQPLEEEILCFESEGNRLPGILSRPERPLPGGPGIVIMSPGLKHRVGPHRLALKLARLFTELGLPVLRFDFHGTGDAEGELASLSVPVLHESIQNGYFASDASNAVAALCEATGVERVVTCGLCGGAITGLYAAEADSRVDGIIGFQLPVKVLDLEADYADQISSEYSDFILTLYLKKIFKPEAWKNFLSGKSEYSLIWKTATRCVYRLLHGGRGREVEIPEGMNLNFLRAYDAVAGRVKMQWIYSVEERARYDFEGDFEKVCLAGKERPYDKVVLPDANHEFAPDEAQARLFDEIRAWLLRNYDLAESKEG
jgi:uncharacterized protein